jgi:rsbT co-antagonist protein RsbR
MSKETPENEIAALRARVDELEKNLAAAEPYGVFFERSLAMLCVADAKGYFVKLNPIWETTLGWALDELLGRLFLDFVHPDDVARTIAVVSELTTGKTVVGFENRYRCKDGSYRHLRWFTAPLDESGFQHAVAQDITEQRKAEERARVFEDTIMNSATGIFVLHLERPGDVTSLRLVMANDAAWKYTGVNLQSEIGRWFNDVFPAAMELGLAEIYMNVATSGGVRDLGEVDYGDARVEQGVFWVKAFGLPDNRVCVNFENITERKKADDALHQAIRQEEIIRAQAAALAELSTPLIPISDDLVVMPLIGTVDSTRAEQVIQTLLNGIAGSSAKTAILDITGVAVVDTQVADALMRAARGVKLLGARVMLTGIRAEVARTLVELGVDFSGIMTHSSLQAGIAAAFRSRRA